MKGAGGGAGAAVRTWDQELAVNTGDTAVLVTSRPRGIADPEQYFAQVVVTPGSALLAAEEGAVGARSKRRGMLLVSAAAALVAALVSFLLMKGAGPEGADLSGAAALCAVGGLLAFALVQSLLPRARARLEGVAFEVGLLSDKEDADELLAMYRALLPEERDAVLAAEDPGTARAVALVVGRRAVERDLARRASQDAEARERAAELLRERRGG